MEKIKNNEKVRHSESALIAFQIPIEVVASVVQSKRTCGFQNDSVCVDSTAPTSDRHHLWWMLLQHLLEVPASMTGGILCHRFRGAAHHDLAALIASIRTEIHDPSAQRITSRLCRSPGSSCPLRQDKSWFQSINVGSNSSKVCRGTKVRRFRTDCLAGECSTVKGRPKESADHHQTITKRSGLTVLIYVKQLAINALLNVSGNQGGNTCFLSGTHTCVGLTTKQW